VDARRQSTQSCVARRRALAAAPVIAIIAAACGSDSTAVTSPGPKPVPVPVTNVALASNPNNALSTIVTFQATGADSARVVFAADDGSTGATPFTTGVDSGRIVVLGLAPSMSYRMVVEARTGDTSAVSDSTAFTTDTLPGFLGGTQLVSSAPSDGGYLLAGLRDGNAEYVVAFDSTGRIAWYRAFNEGTGIGEIKQQENGNVTVFLGNNTGGFPLPGRYVEIAPSGDTVRSFTTTGATYVDNHEFWIRTKDGAYDGAVMLTLTERHVDLSGQGGPADTVVSGHQVVRIDADGSQHVVFDAWDHFSPADNVEPIPGQEDFDHPNALAITADGNYLVSWRNLDAITKIDATTGAILWTLASPWAAVPSDFTIVGDPLGGFSAQHSVRVTPEGNVLLFDNGTHHAPPMSRGIEYHIDENARTATRVREFRHTPSYYDQFTGSVQRLASGNTLIGWTWNTSPIAATEVSPSGSVVWEGTLQAPSPQLPYRFTKIASLYRYERP
jgi:hypothetical protein